MIKTGFLLCCQDNSDKHDRIVISLGFSQDKSELEKELEILQKNFSDRLERFESQAENCVEYVEKFIKAWNKFEKKNVIPFYTPIIDRPTKTPQTREEHAEYKQIKDLNISNNDKNRAFFLQQKDSFLRSWMITNPPDDSFKEFIGVSEYESEVVIINHEDDTSYFICELGKEVAEEF